MIAMESNLPNPHGFSNLFVLIGISLMVISLPLVANLVQRSQDNRSSASETKTPKIAFKFSIEGIKPSYLNGDSSYDCFDQIGELSFDFFNLTTNSSQTNITTTFSPVVGEVNTNGDQVFKTNEVALDSKFNSVTDLNYLKVRWPFTLKSIMCVDNQSTTVSNDSVCNLNLFNNHVYDFSNHPLTIGDLNHDGLINGIDFSYLKVRLNAGANVSCGIEADLNLDGMVNGLDGTLVKKNLLLSDEEEKFDRSTASISLTVNPTTVIPTTIPTATSTLSPTSIPTTKPTAAVQPTLVSIAPIATPTEVQVVVYNPIIPSSFKYSALSDTLKFWIVQNSGYYVTRIWAKEPYKQLKKYTAIDYGKKYDGIDNLLDKAVANAGIKNKVALGINNDIHVSYEAYFNNSDYWKDYSGTGIVLSNGKVYRNDPESPSKRMIVAGINSSNILRLFEESNNPLKINTQTVINNRKELYKSVIDEGVFNTITTFGYCVKNGELDARVYERDKSGDTAERQIMCQVDKNNFIQITTTSGFTVTNVSKIAKDLGCVVAMEMDGGGSTALYYKNASTSGWTKRLNVTTRGKMWSILYWTEL